MAAAVGAVVAWVAANAAVATAIAMAVLSVAMSLMMKPKPRAGSNHLIVPLTSITTLSSAIAIPLLHSRAAKCNRRNQPHPELDSSQDTHICAAFRPHQNTLLDVT